jgi:hypothetical protein
MALDIREHLSMIPLWTNANQTRICGLRGRTKAPFVPRSKTGSLDLRWTAYNMRLTYISAFPFLLVGCARDDVRLQGTWRSDRDATVALQGCLWSHDPDVFKRHSYYE